MAKKQLHIKSGDFVFLDKEEKTGALNVQKWLRKTLKSFGVPLVDPCCDADTTTLPTRYNQDVGVEQFYNPVTETWDTIPGGTGVGGGPYTVTNDLPAAGFTTVTDTSSGFSFVLDMAGALANIPLLTVEAGTTGVVGDTANGVEVLNIGDTVHFWSSDDTVGVGVTAGSAIVDLTVDSSIPALAVAPAVGVAGDVYYNTTDDILYVSDGAVWNVVGGSTSSIITAAADPVGATVGDIYYNTTDNNLYTYDGATWNVIGGSTTTADSVVTSATEPVGAVEGDVYYNTVDNLLYAHDGTDWVAVDQFGIPSVAAVAGTDFFGNAYAIGDEIVTFPDGVVAHKTVAARTIHNFSGAVALVSDTDNQGEAHVEAANNYSIAAADWNDGDWFTIVNTSATTLASNLVPSGFAGAYLRDGSATDISAGTSIGDIDYTAIVRVTENGPFKFLNVYPLSGSGGAVNVATIESGTALDGLITTEEKTQLVQQTVASAATINADLDNGNIIYVNMVTSPNIAAPTNAVAGETVTYILFANSLDRTATFAAGAFKDDNGVDDTGAQVIPNGGSRAFNFKVGPTGVLHRIGGNTELEVATIESSTAQDGLITSKEKTILTTQNVAYAAFMNVDLNAGNIIRINMTGDGTIAGPTNKSLGEQVVYIISATGADRTVTFNADFYEEDGTTLTNAQIIPAGATRAFVFETGDFDLHRVGGSSTNGGILETTSGGAIIRYSDDSGVPPTFTSTAGSGTLVPNGNKVLSLDVTEASDGSGTFLLTHNNGINPDVRQWLGSNGVTSFHNTTLTADKVSMSLTGLNSSVLQIMAFKF